MRYVPYIVPSLEVTLVDDGGGDETKSDLLLPPDESRSTRVHSGRESSARILHCAEFLDEGLHRR